MPQTKRRYLTLLVLPVVALLSLLLVIAVVVFWARSSGNANTFGSRAASSLRLVIVVTRHGNRSPLMVYSTYPYQPNDTNYWPYGPSQLTTKGRKQLYRLGKKFRSMYNVFLSDNYNQEDFLASSTPKDRTLTSAELFVAGLFPPKGFQVWNDDLLWQPVPIYINNLDHTEYLDLGKLNDCPRFKKVRAEMYAKYAQENDAQLTAMFEYARPYAGLTIREIFVLWDSLKSAEREGLALPPWTSKIYPDPLSSLFYNFEHATQSSTVEMTRLVEGQMFQELVRLMEAKANNSLVPDRKMYLYSGHDVTVRALAIILGIDLEKVETGSALVIELHRTTTPSTTHFVEVVYIDGASADLEPSMVTITGCGKQCPLDVLLENTRKYYNITDHKQECQTSHRR